MSTKGFILFVLFMTLNIVILFAYPHHEPSHNITDRVKRQYGGWNELNSIDDILVNEVEDFGSGSVKRHRRPREVPIIDQDIVQGDEVNTMKRHRRDIIDDYEDEDDYYDDIAPCSGDLDCERKKRHVNQVTSKVGGGSFGNKKVISLMKKSNVLRGKRGQMFHGGGGGGGR